MTEQEVAEEGEESEAETMVSLGDRLPKDPIFDPDAILDLFLDWVADKGLELYPAQEEALLEIMAGRHVVLNTPTGSGKSLVAQGLHFKALCEGRSSFYTSPIKALASEKFFALCDDFGAERVGMLTGDASINPTAPLICCTAEVLSNMALRRGESLGADYAVMDEFHYYSDRDRGVAWQIPLIALPETTFLLMSATLGNTAPIEEALQARSGRKVARVASFDRPVPLDYEYRETPMHETVQGLVQSGKAPLYIVSFTQRECAELAQALTSAKISDKDERSQVREAIGDFRFDTPYGKELRRFLGFGIAVHHAGLLPKYRLLVEQLSQKGLLKVICGTDTLGVGVNIPIRTVVFSKLCKFDGRKTSILTVRDFQQIAGRAGRKGFDDEGSVVCQAPDHVIENKKAARKVAHDARKRRKLVLKKPPTRNFVPWNEKTFQRLIEKPPEPLQSRFRVSPGLVVQLLQQDADVDDAKSDNFDSLRKLIRDCHEDDQAKRKHLGEAAVLVRSLYRAGLLKMVRDSQTGYRWVVLDEELQKEFSLHQRLALFLVEALSGLDEESEEHTNELLSVVESILEDPYAVIRQQVEKAKVELLARLKAEGVSYEERKDRLWEVKHPQPLRDFLFQAFEIFRTEHPWVAGLEVRPKSIGREIYEEYLGFNDYIRRYGLQRSEGVLLRYLTQLYKTLVQTVPERARTEGVWDALGFFRTLLERVDTSLLEEWESLVHPELRGESKDQAQHDLHLYALLHDPKAFRARIRAELHQLVRALAAEDWEEAVSCVHRDPDDPWTAERMEAALLPFLAEYRQLLFTAESRQANWTRIEGVGPRIWEVSQVLQDPDGDHLWCLEGVIDLSERSDRLEGPLVHLRRIGL